MLLKPACLEYEQYIVRLYWTFSKVGIFTLGYETHIIQSTIRLYI